MIPDNIIEPIGRTIKPHGINGEIAALVNPDIDLDELSCLIMKIDGINVPFFLESWRKRGTESVLLKFDHISNEIQAEEYCGNEIYVLFLDLPESRLLDESDDDGCESFYLSDLIDWEVYNDGKPIGHISNFDDSTENLLLFVTLADSDREVLIPLADGLIDHYDFDHDILYMNLPGGIIDL